MNTLLLSCAAAGLTALPAAAALPIFSVTPTREVYPGLAPTLETPAALTHDGWTVFSSARPGMWHGAVSPGGSQRIDIPRIPGSVSQGDTGGDGFFNRVGQWTQSSFDNTFETNSTRHEPHVYTPGVGWQSLGRPEGNNAISTAINDRGQVVAAGLNGDNDEFTSWRYTPGVGWQNLGTLSPQGYAIPQDMNNSGTVAGQTTDSQGRFIPYVYTDAGGMQPIRGPGDTDLFGRSWAVNDNNLVAGVSNQGGFIFNAETMEIRFITPPASQSISSINALGLVAGTFNTRRVVSPFDNAGWVATEQDGFNLLENLIGQDLTNPEWAIHDVWALNDQGWIIASAYDIRNQRPELLLLRPVPEPGAAGLGLGALAVFYGRRRRRRHATT